MSQQYSHRNGETEPPTVEGWYFAKPRLGFVVAHQPLVFLAKKAYGKVLFVVDIDKPAADVRARWWGPVPLPWKRKQ
jgi:hypothetical protein